MKKETDAELAHREAAMSKALSMSILFSAENFWSTTAAITKGAKGKEDFMAATKNLLDEHDQIWAWNYLQNYKEELAKKSDFKWKLSRSPPPTMW